MKFLADCGIIISAIFNQKTVYDMLRNERKYGKIICESTYFYGSCEESPNTFRIKFRLKDTVDGKLLQKAV